MLVRNYTPFVPILFPARTPGRHDFWVLALRGTFRVVPDRPLELIRMQEPIVEADIYYGSARDSSLRMENDLAPFKTSTDIHVHAVARSPGRRPSPAWVVSIRVGTLTKTLRVTGPRRWIRGQRAFRLSEPEPCSEVPIRYERAFGGVWTAANGVISVFEDNPVGVGYVPPGEVPDQEFITAAQIESPEDPIRELGHRHCPHGLGPVPRGWLCRRKFAGTYDERWRETRWPEPPEDFDFNFYNSAHPDLIYPSYLKGDEEVALHGLHALDAIKFRLPGYLIASVNARAHKLATIEPLMLDTVVIDALEDRAWLTWRGVFMDDRYIESISIRVNNPTRA